MRRDEPVAERGLRRSAVDAHHGRVGDKRDRAGARHQLAEPLERAELVVDAAGGEDHAVDVRRDRIRSATVERPALVVETAERSLVSSERTIARAHALPSVVDVDVEQHAERPRRKGRPNGFGLHGPAAECDYRRLGCREDLTRSGILDRAECLLTLLEQRLDVDAERLVHVDPVPTEPLRDHRCHRRLPRAHEPNERDVAAERVQCHAMRSMYAR